MHAGQIAVAVFFLLGALGAFMMHRRGDYVIVPGVFRDYLVDPLWFLILLPLIVLMVVV